MGAKINKLCTNKSLKYAKKNLWKIDKKSKLCNQNYEIFKNYKIMISQKYNTNKIYV